MPATPEDPPDLDVLLLGAPRRWTRDQVAEQAGVPLDRARRYWRALGFADTAGAPAFTDRDVEALRRLERLVVDGVVTADTAVALVRALGHTTSRLAVWQVDLVMDQLSGGTGLRSGLSSEEAYRTAERLLPELEPLLVHAWRLQLAAAVDRVLEDDATLVDAVHLTVGFADLVGFTRLSRRLEQRDLAAVVERFEQGAADVVTAAGARLVKTLGDEVLWIAERPLAAVDGRAGHAGRVRRRRAGARAAGGAGHRAGDQPDGRRLRHDGEPGEPSHLAGPAGHGPRGPRHGRRAGAGGGRAVHRTAVAAAAARSGLVEPTWSRTVVTRARPGRT